MTTSTVRAENQVLSVKESVSESRWPGFPHAFLSPCVCNFIQHSDCPSWGRRINTGVSENLFCIKCSAHSIVRQLVALESTDSQRWTQRFCCFLTGVGVWSAISAISVYQPWSLKGHFLSLAVDFSLPDMGLVAGKLLSKTLSV